MILPHFMNPIVLLTFSWCSPFCADTKKSSSVLSIIRSLYNVVLIGFKISRSLFSIWYNNSHVISRSFSLQFLITTILFFYYMNIFNCINECFSKFKQLEAFLHSIELALGISCLQNDIINQSNCIIHAASHFTATVLYIQTWASSIPNAIFALFFINTKVKYIVIYEHLISYADKIFDRTSNRAIFILSSIKQILEHRILPCTFESFRF